MADIKENTLFKCLNELLLLPSVNSKDLIFLFCFVLALRSCVIFLYHGNITWSCCFEAVYAAVPVVIPMPGDTPRFSRTAGFALDPAVCQGLGDLM